MKRSNMRGYRIPVRCILAAAAVGFTGLTGGCVQETVIARLQLKPGELIIERRPDTAYEKLFP